MKSKLWFLGAGRPVIAARTFCALALISTGTSWATVISIPHEFVDGTTAVAQEVNDNFAVLVNESNSQDGRLGLLETTSLTQADLTAHTALPDAHHAKTTSFGELAGQIADGQIPASLTRDNEVVALVLAADGPGSTLDADLLDGLTSTSFALDGEVFGIVLSQDGPGSGLNSDLLDGVTGSAFLRSNVSDAYTGGAMTFNPNTTLNLNGVVSIGTDLLDDNDSLFFDGNGESLVWNNAQTRFTLSDALGLQGPLSVGNISSLPQAYNYLVFSGNPVARGPQMQNQGDLFVQFDLEIGNWLYLNKRIYMNAEIDAGFDADQFIYFYDNDQPTDESIAWDDSSDQFQLTNELALSGTLLGGHVDGTYTHHRFATASTSGTPASGLMNSESDVYVADDIEAGDDIYAGGDVNVDRVVIRGGADLSEGFSISADSTTRVEPGTVMCIDTRSAGALAVCEGEYDRTVAGIVSGAGGINPGMVMSQEGSIAAGDHPVALTGRVYVKADAGRESIQPGDLLTTADRAGYAQRVADYSRSQGAIIGKAMTGLDAGSGLVLVLVALQ